MLKSKKAIIVSVAVLLLALLSAAIWWLFSTGRLAYVTENSVSSTQKIVCDSAIVDRYNTATYYKTREGDVTPTMDEQGLKNLVAEIKKKDGIENDPTCQTILFWTAVREKNADDAKKAYETVKSLHSKNSFADSNLRSNEPLFMYESVLIGLTSTGVEEEEAVGE